MKWFVLFGVLCWNISLIATVWTLISLAGYDE